MAIRGRRPAGDRPRGQAKAPAFSGAAVLTLALAIGANTAIFTLVDNVILDPLPYADAERIIDLDHAAPGIGSTRGLPMSPGLYIHFRDRARTLAEIAVFDEIETTLTGVGDPVRLQAIAATPSLGTVLGVTPARGRWFTQDEDQVGQACNCAVNCGCQFNLPSTHGYCQSAFVGHVVEGHFNDSPD